MNNEILFPIFDVHAPWVVCSYFSPMFLFRRTKLLDIYNHIVYHSWDGSNGNHYNFLKVGTTKPSFASL